MTPSAMSEASVPEPSILDLQPTSGLTKKRRPWLFGGCSGS